jgi:5'-3' exonuclease
MREPEYTPPMLVHLVDGTYELFRVFYGAPSARAPDGREVGATRALLRSFAAMLREPEVTHVAVAFDTVIESFRNRLFSGYKTGDGIDPALFSQFELAERATRALGIVTWSMIEFEADDALATFALRAGADAALTQVRICSPDKDFCQCVQGERIVLYDRKKQLVTGDAGVHERLGVAPAQVPSWLALVGDTADGIPGIPRWGERSAARVLAHYPNVAAIPDRATDWKVEIRGAQALAAELARARPAALLYEQLATLRYDVPLAERFDDLRYRGPRLAELEALCAEIGATDVSQRLLTGK